MSSNNTNVTIKSFPSGFEVILSPELPFEELAKEVGAKFGENARFFGNAKKAISFVGRPLTGEEEDELVCAITGACDVQISCIIVKDESRNDVYFRAVNQFTETDEEAGSRAYTGTVRSGQTLEAEHALIIVGDVNPGAKVVSSGSIVVLGTLYGSAFAGESLDEDAPELSMVTDEAEGSLTAGGCFVAALEMKPSELVINGVTAHLSSKELKSPLFSKSPARIAYEKNGEIILEGITKEFLARL
ncbi:MAG: septum formation inhibitor [Lachnospiraceae bacterium]|nr:septum formation inhibitor [Lachnospiraceae bacterium]